MICCPVNLTKKFLINKDKLTYKIIDGEATILNLDNGNYYSLDEVATKIWQAVDRGKSVGEIINLLNKEYQTPEKKLKNDLSGFIKDMSKEGLIKELLL